MSEFRLKNRSDTLDCIKGSLILLVILGHVIQYNSLRNFDDNIVFRIIYSFHMPTFIMVSGYVYAYTKVNKINIIEFIKKNIYRLIIPFITWYIIKYFVGGVYYETKFLEYIFKLIIRPDNGLWFLWIIFLLRNIFFLIDKFNQYIKSENVLKSELIMLILVYFLLIIIPGGILGIGLLKKYYIFFLLGYIINKIYYKFNNIKINKIIYFVNIFIFFMFSIQWYRTKPPLIYDILINKGEFFIGWICIYIYPLATAILGAISIYIITKYLIIKSEKFKKVFIYFGKNTLGIYGIHYYFLVLFSVKNFEICILINFIVATVISIISVMLLKRFRITRLFLLGER
mgnify:CR=1 FL=1